MLGTKALPAFAAFVCGEFGAVLSNSSNDVRVLGTGPSRLGRPDGIFCIEICC
jgi:hypothetical protein